MIKVVCGIIEHEDKVLICRRKESKSLGGYWEFPGGKIEEGEDFEVFQNAVSMFLGKCKTYFSHINEL